MEGFQGDNMKQDRRIHEWYLPRLVKDAILGYLIFEGSVLMIYSATPHNFIRTSNPKLVNRVWVLMVTDGQGKNGWPS